MTSSLQLGQWLAPSLIGMAVGIVIGYTGRELLGRRRAARDPAATDPVGIPAVGRRPAWMVSGQTVVGLLLLLAAAYSVLSIQTEASARGQLAQCSEANSTAFQADVAQRGMAARPVNDAVDGLFDLLAQPDPAPADVAAARARLQTARDAANAILDQHPLIVRPCGGG